MSTYEVTTDGGTYQIETADAAPSQPAAPSVDQLLGGNNVSALDQGGRLFAGGISKLIPAYGDEAVAGGTALVDAAQNALGMGGAPLGQAYDQRLKEIRDYQQAFRQDAPITNAGVNVAGLVNLPALGLIEGAATIPQKALAGSAELGTLSGALGFGEGEGGFQNRAVSGARSALTGEVIGAPVGAAIGAFQGASGAANQYAQDVLPLSAQDQALADMNISKAQLKTAEKFVPSGPMDEPNLVQAMNGAKESGVISADAAQNTPSAILGRNKQVLNETGDQIDNILTQANAKASAPAVPAQQDLGWWPSLNKFVNDKSAAEAAANGPASKIVPEFPLATNFIKQNPADAEKFTTQLMKRITAFQNSSDGSLASVDKFRRSMYNIGYDGTSDSKVLDQLIGADLKNTVQQNVSSALGPDALAELQALNKTYSIHKTIEPVLKNYKLGTIAKDLKSGPAATPSIFGGGKFINPQNAAMISLLTGHPLGAAAALAGGALEKGLASDTGRGLVSVFSSGAGKALGAGAGTLTAALPLIAAAEGRPNQQGANAPVLPNQVGSVAPSRSAFSPTAPIPNLVSDAQSKIESNNNPNAVSPKGAIGTHQVMPIAFRDVLRSQGVNDKLYTDQQLTEALKKPGVSKKVGDAYYALMLQKYHNEQLALASYNGGPTRVSGLLNATGGSSFQDIAPQLPQETREYVPKVETVLAELRKNASQAG